MKPAKAKRQKLKNVEPSARKPLNLKTAELLQRLTEQGEQAALTFIYSIGPCLSVAESADILHLSSGRVRRKMAANKILWFVHRATNVIWLPKIQFDRGHVAEWVVDVIAAVGNGHGAITFLARRRVSTGGMSYAQLLNAGNRLVVPMIRQRAQQISAQQ